MTGILPHDHIDVGYLQLCLPENEQCNIFIINEFDMHSYIGADQHFRVD